jgi:ribonuclease BN (tRNA processing enzyme)
VSGTVPADGVAEDTVPADHSTWSVLGAGSILPRAGYGCSGYALRTSPRSAVTLFDCGPGTIRALATAGIALDEVRRVVLSHFHPDHCLDVFALAFARRNPAFVAPPLELVGPRGLAAWLETGVAALGHWVRFEETRVVEVDVTETPARLELADLVLSSVHTRHLDTSLAWRAELGGGRSVTYSGDSGECEALAELAHRTSLFVCECSFPEEEAVPNHLTPTGAAAIAVAAGVEKLLLTHFYPAMDPAEARARAARVFSGPIECARDGSVHRVGA